MGNLAVGAVTMLSVDANQWSKIGTYTLDGAIVVAGVNDIIAGESAATMQTRADALLTEIAGDAVPTYFANVAPFGNNAAWSSAKETVRTTHNSWLAANIGSYSGVTLYDLSTLLDDAVDATILSSSPDYDSGDGLHPNDAARAAEAADVGAEVSP